MEGVVAVGGRVVKLNFPLSNHGARMIVDQLPGRSLSVAGPPLVAGGVVAWLSFQLYRRGRDSSTEVYTDLWRPYLWSCIVFGTSVVALGLARTQIHSGADLSVALTFVVLFPWTVFALNFVGRGHLVTRRRLGGGALLTGFLAALALAEAAGVFPPTPDSLTTVSLVASVLAIGELAVAFTAGGLVLLSTYRYRNTTVLCGIVIVVPMVTVVVGAQLTRPATTLLNDVVLGGTSLAVAGSLVAGTVRYDVLSARPATGTTGERVAVRENEEAILTIERDGTLARANRAASKLFGRDLNAKTFSDVVGHDVRELVDCETIQCWTEEGRKQFDPRVVELANEYDEVFGYTVTLIDITDREIRRQRIEVLNRILRHNIRNNLDVIRADAELVTDENRAASILETTETLEQLSADARRIETLLGRSQGERSSTDLGTVVRAVTEDVSENHPAASISFELAHPTLTVDAQLCRFALRNVVENAVVHNDRDEPRVEIWSTENEAGARVIVADDGPGIPESERSVIETRSESQQSHASSLGLWATSWAVQQMGGDISFRDSDLGGTAVVIELSKV